MSKTENFNLSEKLYSNEEVGECIRDVKEFIRLLKAKMPIKPSIFKGGNRMKMIDLINKLAGDKLVK